MSVRIQNIPTASSMTTSPSHNLTQASYSVFECPLRCPGPARYCDGDGVCRSHEEAVSPHSSFDSPVKAVELPSPEGLDRFGHSLEFDAATGMLWLFGGYSPIYGPLNDVREMFQYESVFHAFFQIKIDLK